MDGEVFGRGGNFPEVMVMAAEDREMGNTMSDEPKRFEEVKRTSCGSTAAGADMGVCLLGLAGDRARGPIS